MPASDIHPKETKKTTRAKNENSHPGSLESYDARKAFGMYTEIADLRRKLERLNVPSIPRIILPELHEPETGRIDASKMANFMGVPLKPFAEALGLDYKAVHRNPFSTGIQAALWPVKRSLELLHEFFGSAGPVRIWLNTPHPDLDGTTALQTIMGGRADAVALILENAWNGVPV